jgi:hypothetical protein
MDCLNIFYEQVDHSKYDIIINIHTKQNIDNNTLYFIAPNPPDYRTSYSGSALPFFNKEQAFDNTSNKGKVLFKNKKASFGIKYPNSYYHDLGNIQVVPHVDLLYSINGKEYIYSYKLSDNPIPYRSLTHPYTRTSPLFYKPKTEKTVASQSQLLCDTAYPVTNTSINDFW